ncbi:hypothetical protein [Actinomyces gaoshouyii]|uniref:hypothetical protein n=1 Tax=Actinomyces gaoshouyii TaxID=1960083 RepID=UPI0009BF83E2|nr:hypothetical protein [Actinomyces gaoshouyii]ARD42503.1 hypothetical protein B6G06_09245 [Actinomyces gaoshouyii]
MTMQIHEGPVPGTCARCGIDGQLRIEYRMEAKPLGTFSLAGAQMKVAATRWPWMVCGACGATCRGEPA